MTGFVTNAGLFAHVAGHVVPLPPVREPLAAIAAQWNVSGELPNEVANGLRDLCDAILRGEVEPCACGRYGCDMDEWGELMHGDNEAHAAMLERINADPHDYNNLTNLDLPY